MTPNPLMGKFPTSIINVTVKIRRPFFIPPENQ